jgi:nucleoside-diphosphate-sugar epimerase
MRVAITGMTGYVGSAIAESVARSGHTVVALGRRPVPDGEWRHYELGRALSPDLLAGIDVVVHCAYDLTLTAESQVYEINVQGTQQLARASAAAGARFILISSMSAYEGTRQIYGRAKLSSEAAVRGIGGNVVRLGLVYGSSGGGMIGTLNRLARLPLVPVMGAASYQFLVHALDAAAGVTRLAEAADVHGEVAGLAYPEPVRFDSLIRDLARSQGRSPRLVPIPWRPVYLAMRAAEALRLPLPLRADSVLGLVRPAPLVPNFELWARLGVTVRAPSLS